MSTPDQDGAADNLVLIGFMGSGKSSIARELANLTGRRSVDTDYLVSKGQGLPIPVIFARHGESYFRERESEALRSLQASRRLIIATGGGIVLREENVPLLRGLGCVVWLRANEEVLYERVQRNAKRPLLQTANPRATLAEFLLKRDPQYAACADVTIDTTPHSHAEVAEIVLGLAGRFFAARRQARSPDRGRRVKEAIVEHALGLGFALCRVARCGPPKHGAQFLEWLDEGMAGEMETWLARSSHKRVNPEEVLPGARAVVVLAMNYWQGPVADPSRAADDHGPGGRIARYAWGGDYHDLIQEKLRAMDVFLQTLGGRQRYYVDTGPVLERDFAADAGAGWQGKSTMLLHPELGTWYFLAELLTTLDLTPDAPVTPRCGSCTRCLDACPTGAIRREEPYKLDARRCVSYLTIELKGSIPLEFRPLIGDRIYGCDDCLEACPWNRFAEASREAVFQARAGTTGWVLRDYLALTDEGFRELFRGSPIKRTKRRGFLRNVCVALGNVGGAADLPALERAADGRRTIDRRTRLWAIEQIRIRIGMIGHSAFVIRSLFLLP